MIFDHECAANDAPVLFAGGLRSLGPLLIQLGSPEQQRRYLPAILDGSDLWCQGFSEPNAGSDLAALQMRAVRIGNRYVVSGSKIWTTGAHLANRMFCLVRTSAGGKPQDGITFLLINMASPGISTRLIQTLSGEPEFSEVFFDRVLVPMENRVGSENEGWSVAKLLMRVARGNNTTAALLRRSFRRLTAIAEHNAGDSALRIRMYELDCELRLFEAFELRLLHDSQANGITAVQSSMMKTIATELHQGITAAALEASGYSALEFPSDCSSIRPGDDGRHAGAKYFATRAASIYSGTNETHRNLIAGHLSRQT
jgi:acyl-CoA dehydrogenase